MKWWVWILLIFLIFLLLIIVWIDMIRYLTIHWTKLSEYERVYFNKPRVQSDSRVVVSLTTIPDRIEHVNMVLKSILDQTVRVDAIYLWIPERCQRTGEEYHIPPELENLSVVQLRRIDHDYGPATKLLPALLEEEPDTKIIFVDDDRVYGKRVVETLVNESMKDPDSAFCVFGMSLRSLFVVVDCYLNYLYWIVASKKQKVDLILGVNGSLVKPRFFSLQELFNYKDAPEEAFFVDDAWFSGHLAKNKIKRYSVSSTLGLFAAPTINREKNPLSRVNSDMHNWQVVISYFESYWNNV